MILSHGIHTMAADALRAVRILAILASLGCIFVPLRLLYSQQRAGFSSAHQYQTRPGSLIPDIATLKPNSTPYKAIELGLELVVASLKSENTSWVHEYLPDWPASIYVVDDPDAPLTVPKNKGNEAMVYLTYVHPSPITNFCRQIIPNELQSSHRPLRHPCLLHRLRPRATLRLAQ